MNQPQDDKAHADIGLVCALPMEVQPFLDRCEHLKKYTGGSYVFRGGFLDRIKVAVVQTGVGFARARAATQALIDAHSPPWVLSIGFSGALQSGMRVGDIVVATSICDLHGQELTNDVHFPEDPENGLYVGRILNADEIVRTVEEKQKLATEYDALAVDLESLAVAQICHAQKRGFMAIRVISDDCSTDLPKEVLSILGETGAVRAGAALGAVFKRPESIKEMWKMRGDASRAATRLASFLEGVVVQLYDARH
ncbi:5'-methylthioadenosine/S-adenosylhomocysteine nucleosidase [Gimesia chilikensis]|uniref:5'-methylthioadenosine/S-adenosylhomocysteine nucleosidase n=1 Tax=Gimesia chilikensis TaxID=2605989 RepID=A0A517WEX9_9PLAN|nr:5'-methylthioadenosine nucleosidase [Gimesia chilikensis]QDU03816.1 5'-methylthioadenosine/S-adenosylhomocysteine nucleosidase [Gimesia chilikensis]